MISGSQDGKISMYSVETGKCEQVMDPQNGKFPLSIAYVSYCQIICAWQFDLQLNWYFP